LMGQARNECVGAVCLQLRGLEGNCLGKDGQISLTDGLRYGEVGTEFGFHALEKKDVSFGDFSHLELYGDQRGAGRQCESQCLCWWELCGCID
jgi:hypothetical protein